MTNSWLAILFTSKNILIIDTSPDYDSRKSFFIIGGQPPTRARGFMVLDQQTIVENSTVDIIMPIFNESKWLCSAINSLYNQTLLPTRIIVINDASTDESGDLLDNLLKIIPILEVTTLKRNVGSIEAAKLGYLKSNAKFVLFASAHCQWKPKFLEVLVSKLEINTNICFACCEVLQVNHTLNKTVVKPSLIPVTRTKYLTKNKSISLLRKSDNWILSMGTLYRSECIKKFRMFELDFASMTDGFISRKMVVNNGFYFISEVLCTWNLLESSQSFRLSYHPFEAKLLINEICEKIVNDLNFPDWYSKKYYRRQHFSNLIRLQKAEDVQKYTKEAELDLKLRLMVKVIKGNGFFARKLRLAFIYIILRPFYLRRLVFSLFIRNIHCKRLFN